MSKTLEALTEIKRQVGNIHYFDFTQNPPRMTLIPLLNTPFFDIIETALKDYENTKARLDDTQSLLWKKQERIEELEETNNLMVIREHKNTNKLKALEIIKEKRVDVGWLISCENIKQYNNVIGTATHRLLTQKEYDFLKKVLL